MKTVFSAALALFFAVFLGGCMMRATGPCLGYGCPAMSGSSNTYHAANTNSSKQPLAKRSPADDSRVQAGQ
ncbi:MAG TPA: hypothetical protein VFW94_00300 [Candidatus Acidoferrales bacterium]|nr:hypothetical protein [Candidatus Acidoferrales bacterium]